MHIGEKIKKIREKKGLLQKDVATHIGMHTSNYSKLEKAERDISVEALTKVSELFGMSVDDVIHFEESSQIKEIKIEDRTSVEQLEMIQELEPEDKEMIFRMINTLLTKKRFKDFFEKQFAAS